MRLGDVIEIKHGYAFSGKHIIEEDNGIVLVTPGNFKIGGGFQEKKCKFFDGEIPHDYVLKRGDIIVTMTDLSKTIDTLGYSALVPQSDKRMYLHNQRIGLVLFKNETCDSGYIYWLMRTHQYQREIANTSTGSTVHHTSPTKICDYEFEAPPLEAQHRIATILSRYDSLIENYQKQIKLLEEAAQRLYKEWFVDLHFPSHENTKIIDGLPEGWEKKKLIEFGCSLESGSRPKGGVDSNLKDGIPSVGAENVIGLGKYNYSSEKLIASQFYSQMKKGKIKDRDILIYKDGAYIGRTSLFQDGFPHKEMAVNEHVFLLHTINENYQYYVFFTLYQKQYFEKMQKLNKNAAQPGLNQKALLDLILMRPSANFVLAFRKANQIRLLTEARDRLLPKLMSGEIQVKKK